VLRTVGLTAVALLCFASNSLLCRAALRPRAIDPASFTLLRIASGALVLALLSRMRAREKERSAAGRDWVSPAALFAYAIAFSFAYVRLSAGTGALVLFGAVQVTMLASAIGAGERPRTLSWVGMVLAMAGLVGLTLPGLDAPDPIGAGLMAAAGVAWAVYTLRGRGATDPVGATARNFAWGLPLAVLAWVVVTGALGGAHAAPQGLTLAAVSGGIASGLGYVAWYAALPSLSATRAAVLQLSVPAITAALAVVVLGEGLTSRLALSSLAVLGGIGIVLRWR